MLGPSTLGLVPGQSPVLQLFLQKDPISVLAAQSQLGVHPEIVQLALVPGHALPQTGSVHVPPRQVLAEQLQSASHVVHAELSQPKLVHTDAGHSLFVSVFGGWHTPLLHNALK
jgi:hypothetical protein